MKRILVAASLLLLTGCGVVERRAAFQSCLDRCTGDNCIEKCGNAVAKIFGTDKENEHVFGWKKTAP